MSGTGALGGIHPGLSMVGLIVVMHRGLSIAAVKGGRVLYCRTGMQHPLIYLYSDVLAPRGMLWLLRGWLRVASDESAGRVLLDSRCCLGYADRQARALCTLANLNRMIIIGTENTAPSDGKPAMIWGQSAPVAHVKALWCFRCGTGWHMHDPGGNIGRCEAVVVANCTLGVEWELCS